MKALNSYLLFVLLLSLNPVNAVEVGFSGMARVGTDSFLVVMDKKGYQPGPRIGLLKTSVDEMPTFSPIEINDWNNDEGQASDLESVCQFPTKDNEFLLAESGYWKGKSGRIFHVELTAQSLLVKQVYKLPLIISNDENVDGDNFEGLVCFARENKIYVVLGERGGSEIYPDGLLRIGILDDEQGLISWDVYKDKSLTVVAPKSWGNPQTRRTISDLHLDTEGVIWAVATEDAGDEGPFRSIIYQAAKITDTSDSLPVKIITNPKIAWRIDGFKVEALAAPASTVPGSTMSIGTEDESYGGTWRPLFAVDQ